MVKQICILGTDIINIIENFNEFVLFLFINFNILFQSWHTYEFVYVLMHK